MALNYYLLLGVPPDADQQRIKTVYRKLAKRFHPDTNNGSETAAELFRQVNQAYLILSDSRLRACYDQKLARKEAVSKERKSTKVATAKVDPQQKFNRFVTSLLDALFGAADGCTKQTDKSRSDHWVNQNMNAGNKPAFNFYYHVAMEKESTAYICGKDGIYRKIPTKKTPG